MIGLTKLFFVLLAACFVANAGAVGVTYTVSGSSGAWDLNFTVANNMTVWPTQDIYQFGVQSSVANVIGSPTGYDPAGTALPWTNLFRGGSLLQYNNAWLDFVDFNHLLPGQSLSGFIVEVSGDVAPTTIPWFAYSFSSALDPGDLYTGSGAFNVDPNFGAGFEGVAVAAPAATAPAATVPEASPLGLMLIGLGTCVFLRRKAVWG